MIIQDSCEISHRFMLAALLETADIEQDSWPVLPEGLTFTGYTYRFLRMNLAC